MYDVLQLAPGFSSVLPECWLPETESAGSRQDRWNRRPNRRMEVMLGKEKCQGDKVQCWGLCPTNFIGTRDLGRVLFWFSLFMSARICGGLGVGVGVSVLFQSGLQGHPAAKVCFSI